MGDVAMVRAVGGIQSAFVRISLDDESDAGRVEAGSCGRGSGAHCGYVASGKPGDHWLTDLLNWDMLWPRWGHSSHKDKQIDALVRPLTQLRDQLKAAVDHRGLRSL